MMQRRRFLSCVLRQTILGGTVCSVTGCGAFIHSERIGQPHSNQIDWKIAALDGLGLILFFVPGVIAFVVDFSTGAIYLPLEQAYPGYGMNPMGGHREPPLTRSAVPSPVPTTLSGAASSPRATWQNLGLKRVAISREQLCLQRIELVVSDHVGHDVCLDDVPARLSALPRIDQFDAQLSHHRSDGNFGHPIRSFFSRLASA